MPPPPSAASRDETVIRDRGDACPGALRLHAADDGYLARVRIPGGMLTPHQASVLGLAADRFGDGHLELTSRGNVQLRGLAERCGDGLARLLDSAGLLPAPGHERIRNVVASATHAVEPWIAELDRLLCANARVAALSGRFLFALDDGSGDVSSLDPDVTVLGERSGTGPAQEYAGALVRLGTTAAGAVRVSAADAPRAALLAAEYFLDAAAAAGTGAWRVAELPAEHAPDHTELAARLEAADIGATPVADPAWPWSPPPAPWGGSRPSRHQTLTALVPLGRLSTGQWRELVQVADRSAGPLRITPWRSVVLRGAPVTRPFDGPARLRSAGLVLDGDSPWRTVTACTGRPGCAKALADVRADARALLEAADGPLPVHWSGCERRCGHPRGSAWADVVATADGYRVGRAPGPAPATAPTTATESAPAPDPAPAPVHVLHGGDLAGAVRAARGEPAEPAEPRPDTDVADRK
ncbi:cobalamin biosynthesis protein CobG [Streptomyces sp. NPDC012888]|uniref:cobalamin biosynthesis protein CobG n=1 Tax=Streptomyces sp. NPDC012888 TaxID=3364855 RepID=UPI00367603E8